MKMRTSHFGFVNQIEQIAAAGYDSVELHIKEIMGFDHAEFQKAKKTLSDSGIPSDVFDNPLPLDVVVADPGFDFQFYTEYLRKAVDRTAQMGCRYFVYGNGKTRSLPEEGDIAGATEKNDQMIRVLCELAAEANITVLIEPLAAAICNRFLGIPENVEYARKTGIPNLKTFLDYRWFLAGGHDLSVIEQYADYIHHVHIDNPDHAFPKRLVPMPGDGHDYTPLFDILKKICYKGIISYEANTFENGFETDIKKGLELLQDNGIESYCTLKQAY